MNRWQGYDMRTGLKPMIFHKLGRMNIHLQDQLGFGVNRRVPRVLARSHTNSHW